MELNHHFTNTCYDIDELFDNGNIRNLGQFMRRLNKQAEKYPERFSSEDYKGDGFECLVEAIVKLNPVNPRLNLTQYNVTPPGTPGVDALAKTLDLKRKVGVQAKYDSTTQKTLSNTNTPNLAMFPSTSLLRFKCDALVLFTTGKGLNEQLNNEAWDGQVITFGIKDIKKFTNNITFWRSFYQLIKGVYNV